MIVLETERLVLRHLTPEDAPFMLDLLNQPSFLRFIGDRGVRTVEGARQYIADGPAASYAHHGFGLYLTATKAGEEGADGEGAGGEPIGICGLVKRDFLPDVDIGFALLPQYWSKGYAYEAAAAVLEHARQLGHQRVVAITSPDNEASGRLLEKLGLRFERMLRLAEDDEVRLYATESRWSRLANQVAEDPAHLEGYSERLEQDARRFRDDFAFRHDED